MVYVARGVDLWVLDFPGESNGVFGAVGDPTGVGLFADLPHDFVVDVNDVAVLGVVEAEAVIVAVQVVGYVDPRRWVDALVGEVAVVGRKFRGAGVFTVCTSAGLVTEQGLVVAIGEIGNELEQVKFDTG